ncbi:DUF1488 family protein [Sulfuricurvum sp.]|nr:DUF1488 family protein [Sulfuricurvum sp.]MDD2267446.1 DUF1488 family protein [Sulfuricurvum sp.]
MNIQFNLQGSTPWAVDKGISFIAKVDGNNVTCTVTKEYLTDCDPVNKERSDIDKFNANKYRIQSIAEDKIRNKIFPVIINKSDLK